MLEWIAGSLVLVGLSIVLSFSWLRRSARQYVALAQELIGRRADIGGDVLAWFGACRSTLEQAGVNGLRYRGLWFGGEVAGDADCLLFPNLEAGNVFYKANTKLAGGEQGAIVMGARVPAVLSSRGDSEQTKLYSIALAALVA